jgi:hypothetical protein
MFACPGASPMLLSPYFLILAVFLFAGVLFLAYAWCVHYVNRSNRVQQWLDEQRDYNERLRSLADEYAGLTGDSINSRSSPSP